MRRGRICLSGEVMWGRLSPHPATERGRVRPTKAAPITLFLREDADWLAPANNARPPLSHPGREVLEVLENQGASFFPDLTRLTGRLPAEVEDALWELIAAGLTTLLDPAVLMMLVAGLFAGLIIGSIPGINDNIAFAVFIPFSFSMPAAER